MYSVLLQKIDGQIVIVITMGMGHITEEIQELDILPAAKLFPVIHVWKLMRPRGAVDLLIGIGMAQIHSYLKDVANHRRKNLRNIGIWIRFLLDGTHETIQPRGEQLCSTVF